MTIFPFKGVFTGVALAAAFAIGDIPQQMHPDFELKEVALPNKYKTTGMGFLSDGRLVITTTDSIGGGEIPKAASPTHKVLIITNPGGTAPTVKEVANTWLMTVGLTIVDDKVYVSDRDGFYEILNLNPKSTELSANRKKIASWPDTATWAFGKNWHQFVFTPVYWQGNFYAPYSGSIRPGGWSDVDATTSFSGAFLKWDLTGKLEKFAGGLRSPNGLGINPSGEMFVADNQGSWLPSSTFMHMKKDKFYGHRQSVIKDNLGNTITHHAPNWAESLPYEPPTAWLPHQIVRASPSQPLYVDKGRFLGDWLLGDENNEGLVRIALDGVEDTYNGSVFWFGKGFGSAAPSRMAWGMDGSIYMGTIQGLGNWPHSTPLAPIYKITPKAAPTAFELRLVRHVTDGLEIHFTEAVDPATITVANFPVKQWTYTRSEEYGGGKGPELTRAVSGVEVSTDGKRVHLKIPTLMANHLTYLKLNKTNVKSASGALLWNNESWYTLNKLSTRAWNGTASLADNAPEASSLNALVRHRISAGGLEVIVDASGPMSASLRTLDGSSVRSGSGEGSLVLATHGLAKGVYLLDVRKGAQKVLRPVSLSR